MVWKGHQLYPKATAQIMSSTYFYHLRPPQNSWHSFIKDDNR